MSNVWDVNEIPKLSPTERHYAWLEHEHMFHKDPETQKIIREITMMLKPGLFVALLGQLELAQILIKRFLK